MRKLELIRWYITDPSLTSNHSPIRKVVNGGKSMRNLLRFCALLLWFCALSTQVVAQEQAHHQSDSMRTESLLAQSIELRNSNADSSLYCAKRALKLSHEVNNLELRARCYNQVGILYRYRGELDLAAENYEQSLEHCKRLNDSLCMAHAWLNLGVLARKKGQLSEALNYTLACIPHFEKAQDSKMLGHAYNGMGNIYSVQENWPKALENYKRVLTLQRGEGNQVGEARALYNMGIAYYNQNELHKADSVIHLRLELSAKLNDKRALANAYHSLGIIQKELKNGNAAREYLEKAAALQQEMEDQEGQLFSLLGLGELEEVEQHWERAEKTFRLALDLAMQTGLKDEELTARKHLATILEKLGKHPAALDQLKRASLLSDTLRDESTSMKLLELQEKYETDKKEKENTLLQQENQLKANEIEAQSQSLLFRNAALVVLLVVLLLSGLLLFNYQRRLQANRELAKQREELNRQKMLDLVREQELAYVNATLIGQETERNRIAMELHDGLSNMLVTVKLHFENLADQLQSENPNALSKYHDAVALLNDLCKKARGLSHELADEHSQFRLEPALKELVGIIQGTGQIEVELSLHGTEQPIGAAIENAVFHALRELIGNCLKHAEAKSLSIQLTRFDNALNVLVEDDGKGFDPRQVQSDGMGLSNLNSRVENLGGTIHIDAALGRGTVVNIDIPIGPPAA